MVQFYLVVELAQGGFATNELPVYLRCERLLGGQELRYENCVQENVHEMKKSWHNMCDNMNNCKNFKSAIFSSSFGTYVWAPPNELASFQSMSVVFVYS